MAAIRSAALALLLIAHPFRTAATIASPAGVAVAGGSAEGASVTGLVRDAATSEPLPGAIVALPELERGVVTGPEGRYAILGVPPGPQHIVVRLIGYESRTLHALVPREGVLEINLALQPHPLHIRPFDVRAPVAVRGLEPGDSTTFPDREASSAAIRHHPLLTEPDAVQALEGGEVALRPETPSGAHIRGGATEHLAYLLDGIPVFSPFHTAGLSSAWNPDALSRLRFHSSEPAHAQPHTLAGSLDAATRAPGDRFRAQGSFSATQARLTLDGPLGRGVAGYLVSLRTGFTGLLTRKDESSHLRGDTGDWLTKLEAPALGGRLRILGYASINEIDAASASGAEGGAEPPPPRNTFDWGSRSVGAEWRRPWSRSALRLMAWSAAGDADAGWRAEAGRVRLASDRRDLGLLADYERRASRSAAHGGFRVERTTTAYRVRADSAFTLDWSLDARTAVATVFGGYERGLGRRVALGGGASLAFAERAVRPSPRASLRWTPADRLSLTGTYARTHQFVQSLRNPESVVGTIFPVDLYAGAGAPGIPTARSDQGVLAIDWRPAPGMRLSLQGYLRHSDRLVLVAPRSGEPFALGSFTVGAGPARGASLEWGVRAARYGIVASYGYQHVRLEYGDSSYVPEHGAAHLLHGGIILFPASTLSVRLGAVALWGRRTTTATGDFEWEACNLLDRGCEFGGSPHYAGQPLGGTSLPPYYRVDLGLKQHWHVAVGGRDVSIALFGAFTNLLGRKNLLTYARDPATGGLTAIEMRPRAPLVVGMDWQF